MDIFEKCYAPSLAGELKEKGVYPYFHALQSRQDVEVMMEGKRRIMLGSNNYLGLTTDPVVVEDQSITTAGTQKLYLGRDDADLIRGKRILLMDDVISTGGSIHAMEELVKLAGGTVVGRVAVLAEGDGVVVVDDRVAEDVRLVAEVIDRLLRDDTFLQPQSLCHRAGDHIPDDHLHRDHL